VHAEATRHSVRVCADLHPGSARTPLFLTGSRYFPPSTDDVTLLGHVTRPSWAGPAYAAAAAAAAAYYRYAATAALPSPSSPSPFPAQFPAGYPALGDPLRYCGTLEARASDVDRCLQTLGCAINTTAPLHSPPISWQRAKGTCQRLTRPY